MSATKSYSSAKAGVFTVSEQIKKIVTAIHLLNKFHAIFLWNTYILDLANLFPCVICLVLLFNILS